ncbi:MAG TPA: hypothetical protein VKV95_11860 [Terriglobia bacterium]|nr:hypothetical protein [Terriglobia bacterium]
MKKALMVLLVVEMIALPSGASRVKTDGSAPVIQTAEANPTVDQVLEKYVASMGGRAALEKFTTRVMKASVILTDTGEAGTLEIYKKAPDKEFFSLEIPSNGPAPRAYNGKAGWVVYDPDEGPQDVGAKDLPAMKREFNFYREIQLKILYPKMTLKGREKVGAEEAYVIEAFAGDGAMERWYFSTQSGLLLRTDTPYVNDDGQSVLQTTFGDYRDVDGVKFPFMWRQTCPDFDYDIRFTTIQNNVSVDDARFEKPKAQ